MPVDDGNLTKTISEYQTVLIIEDHYIYGGISDVISRLIAENNLNVNFSGSSL